MIRGTALSISGDDAMVYSKEDLDSKLVRIV
jgi:hypothetical protein